MRKNYNKGFVLIFLLLAVVIIAILVTVYYGKSTNNKTFTREAGQSGIEQAEKNNQLEYKQQLELQNQINSMGN